MDLNYYHRGEEYVLIRRSELPEEVADGKSFGIIDRINVDYEQDMFRNTEGQSFVRSASPIAVNIDFRILGDIHVERKQEKNTEPEIKTEIKKTSDSIYDNIIL